MWGIPPPSPPLWGGGVGLPPLLFHFLHHFCMIFEWLNFLNRGGGGYPLLPFTRISVPAASRPWIQSRHAAPTAVAQRTLRGRLPVEHPMRPGVSRCARISFFNILNYFFWQAEQFAIDF